MPFAPQSNDEEEATLWMRRGVALLDAGTSSAAMESVSCFERAIALREPSVQAGNERLCYDLAGSWTNRGDALMRAEGRTALSEAVHSYDQAVRWLETIPPPLSREGRYRLALTWHNRGLSLQMGKTQDFSCAAVESLDQALATMGVDAPLPSVSREAEACAKDGDASPPIPRPDVPGITDLAELRLVGCAWMNRGNVLLDVAGFDSCAAARLSAQNSLAWLAGLERSDRPGAEASLKASHVLCRAITGIVTATRPPSAGARTRLLDEASDVVDDALSLIRHWEKAGETQFRQLGQDIFRFGARLYQVHQPRYLVEFILEALDPRHSGALPLTDEAHEFALDALWRSLRSLQRDGFGTLHKDGLRSLQQAVSELRRAEERLAAIRQGNQPALTATPIP